MGNAQAFVSVNGQLEYPIELLKPERHRTRTKLCTDAIKYEINGLLERGAFRYVNRKQLPCETIQGNINTTIISIVNYK